MRRFPTFPRPASHTRRRAAPLRGEDARDSALVAGTRRRGSRRHPPSRRDATGAGSAGPSPASPSRVLGPPQRRLPRLVHASLVRVHRRRPERDRGRGRAAGAVPSVPDGHLRAPPAARRARVRRARGRVRPGGAHPDREGAIRRGEPGEACPRQGVDGRRRRRRARPGAVVLSQRSAQIGTQAEGRPDEGRDDRPGLERRRRGRREGPGHRRGEAIDGRRARRRERGERRRGRGAARRGGR